MPLHMKRIAMIAKGDYVLIAMIASRDYVLIAKNTISDNDAKNTIRIAIAKDSY